VSDILARLRAVQNTSIQYKSGSDIMRDAADEIERLRAALARRDAVPNGMMLPELDDDLREILGKPNFRCSPIAQALRLMGKQIAHKAEDEQAATIHWMLGLYFKNGKDWRSHGESEVRAAMTASENREFQ